MSDIVDIYCRTATSDGETDAKLEGQETACRAYCETHGLAVGMVYREVAGGHTYQNRPLLAAMRERYKRGESNGVVVTRFDRLSRNLTSQVVLITEIENAGAAFYCVQDSWSDQHGRILHTMLSLVKDVDRERVLVNREGQ